MSRHCVQFAFSVLILVSGGARASCWEQVQKQLESPTGISVAEADVLDDEARDCLSHVLTDPDTLNRAVQGLTARDSGAAFLRDIHWAFKSFTAPDATDANRVYLGAAYSYDKSIVTAPLKQDCGPACTTALNLKFTSQGNIAFDSAINPRDFLESHLNLAWFRSSGGARQLSATAQDVYNDLAIKMAMVPAGQEAQLETYHRELAKLIANNLSNQWYVDVGADLSFESDQTFRQKHFVYAARAALDFRGWQAMDAASWQATSLAARLNIFDYPFALLRRFTGYSSCDARDHSLGSCIVPLGTSWPAISVAIGRVQPSLADPRTKLLGSADEYTRVATEVSFKTPVAKWSDQPIYVSANYRVYDELSAPDSVAAADLAHFSYLAVIAGPQQGLFASYSTGRLPFDKRSDQIYELGFRFFLQ